MAEGDEYLTVAEVARLLRVHRTTVWRWITAGRLHGYRLGTRTLRVRRDDLRRFLHSAAVSIRPPYPSRPPVALRLAPSPGSVLAVTGGRGAGVYPPGFEYAVPTTVAEALDLLAQRGDEAKVLAGGQSLIPLMKLRLASPAWLIDINRISELDYVREDGEGLRVGALVRHRTLERSTLVARRYPTIAAAAPQIADPLVRNLGTLAGSLCHADPQGDWGAVAVAMDARLVARSRRGERVIAASEFFRGPLATALQADELVTEVIFPPPPDHVFGTYLKLERKVGDFATVGVAVVLHLDGGRVARAGIGLTAVGPTYLRARRAEALLGGRPLDDALAVEAGREAAAEAEPTSDHRGSADYKRQVVRVFVTRALRQALAARAA